MALVGNLKDLKLPSLIQLNCMERNTAKLTIEHSGKFGFVYFENGQVVHAEYDPDIGEKAVFRLLTLYAGKFKVESGIRAPVRTIHTNWNNLLLDGLHQLDSMDDNPERRYDHLFERLFTVKGVKTALIFDKEGAIIANSSGKSQSEDALHALVLNAADKIGMLLKREGPDYISISAASQKYIYAKYNQYFVLLEMDQKIKLDVVLPLIKQALA